MTKKSYFALKCVYTKVELKLYKNSFIVILIVYDCYVIGKLNKTGQISPTNVSQMKYLKFVWVWFKQ